VGGDQISLENLSNQTSFARLIFFLCCCLSLTELLVFFLEEKEDDDADCSLGRAVCKAWSCSLNLVKGEYI
jgi:hypothetical protein